MSTDLSVENLYKSFDNGSKPAIDGVSFSAAEGEVIVLLGPSGCGKTTTLRCVAGLEHPTAGVIRIGGGVVSDPAHGVLLPPRKRDLGMVFQSYAVWPHMTVQQNVAYPLKERKLSGGDAEARVAKALETVGLGDYAQRSVGALSGGQMQRVALARSLVYRPRLLLLDEPLSNLDAKLRLRLRDELRQIIKAAGITALYVTHDQSEAIALADRIGVMRDGKLLQIGSATEIYDRPATLFVANFTGATNHLDGKLLSQTGDRAEIELGSGVRLTADLPQKSEKGGAMRLAIRPEGIELGPMKAGVNRLEGEIVSRSYLGIQTSYRIKTADGEIEAIELGSTPRHVVGQLVSVSLGTEGVWAYPTGGA